MLNQTHRRAVSGLLAAALVVTGDGSSSAARAADEADFEKLMNDKGPAFVTLKYVLQMKGPGGEGADEREITAVMIQADGLVLCSNSQFGGAPFMRAGGATPKDIKVLIGDDTQGLDARLIARDTELDLAWLKIKEPGDKKFAFLDVSKAATPKVGDRLYTLVRLGKYFDRATVVREFRIGGTARKPRMLYIPSQVMAGPGMPVFTSTGDLVGVAVVQLPDAEELAAATSMAAFVGSQGLILPSADVGKATKRALEADAAGDGETKEEAEVKKD